MGGNASPLIADLFLASLEFRYNMDKLVSSKSPENLRMAKKLSNNSRYIDDTGVCNMNNNNEFICSKDIYPESIPLTAGCIENDEDTFLDLDITIEENRFITKIYHKVDDFDFEVVSFPFPTSNMSDQLVRFSSVCSKFNDFDIRSKILLESLLNRGFSKYRLKNSFKKFVLNHHDVLDIKYSMEEIN